MKITLVYSPINKGEFIDTSFRLAVHDSEYTVQTSISSTEGIPVKEIFKEEVLLNKAVELDMTKVQGNKVFDALLGTMINKFNNRGSK